MLESQKLCSGIQNRTWDGVSQPWPGYAAPSWGAVCSPEPPGGRWCHWAPAQLGQHSRLERKPPNSHVCHHCDCAVALLHQYSNSMGILPAVTPQKTLIFLLAWLWEKGTWLLMASNSPLHVIHVHVWPIAAFYWALSMYQEAGTAPA